MNRTVFNLVSAAVVLLGGLLVLAAAEPDRFRVERVVNIEAPPERIFALIDDFRSWGAWSPYEKLDPDMQRRHRGAARGEGAVYEWHSDGRAGVGRMEILDTSPPSRLTIRLDFAEPFESHSTAEFTLEPDGETTNVTWTMHGPSTYLSKLMNVFVSMDSMIGKDFEAGLANMKAIAERRATAATSETARRSRHRQSESRSGDRSYFAPSAHVEPATPGVGTRTRLAPMAASRV